MSNLLKNKTFWVFVALIATFIAYMPVFQNDFVNWDDDYYITGNNLIQSFDLTSVKTWFSRPFMGLYQPMILVSLALDYSINGNDPVIFHTTNLMLHLLNTLLVFVFLSGLLKNDRVSIMATLLFGLHPIHVEAVAWATERKELLYGFFYLLALVSYLQFLKQQKTRWLLTTFILFIFSLLSKASAVTLPLVLVLLDYLHERIWPDRKVILEKLMFFIPALVFGLLTLYWHRSYGSLVNASGFSLPERAFLAGRGLMYLLSKTIWPLDLSAYNQLPGNIGIGIILEIFFYWALIGIALYTLIRMRLNNRMLIFGAGFFLLTIFLFLIPPGVPVLISERYAYLPSIGLFVIIGVGFNRVFNKQKMVRDIGVAVLGIYLLFIMFLTFQQSKTWRNSLSLWNHVIEVRGDLAYPLYQKGNAYREKGEYDKALQNFDRALQKRPRLARVLENRGHIYLLLNNYESAISDLNKATTLDPESEYAHCTLGFAYRHTGEFNKAIKHLNKAIELKKDYADAYFNRGKIYLEQGNTTEACADLKQSLHLDLDQGNAREARQLISENCR
ncbi:MAG: tetratricopeptide repeat protein [Bacteroidales bacterium]|nr:tetratricopeptide repeat protein [Bacteroidales bacterium]